MTREDTMPAYQRLHELLIDLATEGTAWLEALDTDSNAQPWALMDAIDDYTIAAKQHMEAEEILEMMEGSRRVVTMEEIEEIKRREREERGEG